MSQKALANLEKIHDQNRKRSYGYMLRELALTPINALFLVGSTGYMFLLSRSTAGLENPVTQGDVWFVVTSSIPLVMMTITQMGSTFSKGYEASPFYKAYRELSKSIVLYINFSHLKQSDSLRAPAGCTVSLNNVSFSYDRSGELPDTLSGVTFDIRPGTFVGIVGEIGAGKTTMFELLCGLRTPTGGKLLVNGKSLTTENRQDWVKKIGFVFQDPYQFSSITMREFLTLGNDDVDVKFMEKILQISGFTNILEERYETKSGAFKSRFPLGLDTPLGQEFEGGKKLSGGERQLLSICRALLRKPEVLFLDEATANLNPTQRKTIRNIIERRAELLGINPTVIQISHTLKAVKNADFIYVVDKKTRGVSESGTHDELLALNGGYAREWSAETND